LARQLYVEIVTAERLVYSGSVAYVNAPSVEGRIGILPGHAALLAALRPGELRLQPQGGEAEIGLAIGGGFLEVSNNRVIILAHSAERATEIDVDRALQARERAVNRLQTHGENIDSERARSAMDRAQTRLRVAEHHRRLNHLSGLNHRSDGRPEEGR
jgi:F-type H+-transporting ATPase subunit epsilon